MHLQLNRINSIIFYGDNIPDEPSDVPTQDAWRVRLAMARKWRDTVNKHSGDVTVVHLPEIGIKGNTHFPFSDLNSVQIADHVDVSCRKELGLIGCLISQERRVERLRSRATTQDKIEEKELSTS